MLSFQRKHAAGTVVHQSSHLVFSLHLKTFGVAWKQAGRPFCSRHGLGTFFGVKEIIEVQTQAYFVLQKQATRVEILSIPSMLTGYSKSREHTFSSI